MDEFKVSEYITLKLENGQTNIYVAGELFNQCKFLLLNIPIQKISSFDDIDSVDEAAEKLYRKMEGSKAIDFNIPPEVEFWAHCSHMQVWAEHDYDTRLIHSNLAFPLIKHLTEVGDPLAKAVFKEEIVKRLESGYFSIIKFLTEEGFTSYLTPEEYYSSVLKKDKTGLEEVEFLIDLEYQTTLQLDGFHLDIVKELEEECGRNLVIENNRLTEISAACCNLKNIPETIGRLKSLRKIIFAENNLRKIPSSIGKLENLEILDLTSNEIQSLPNSIINLKSLKKLNLSYNQFKSLPDFIGEIDSLEFLNLKENQIINIPDTIGNLKYLKVLNIGNNQLKKLPDKISKLSNLEELKLNNNQLKELPKSIGQLKSLKTIDLFSNNLHEIPDSILDLDNLKKISLMRNNFSEDYLCIKKLKEKNINVYI